MTPEQIAAARILCSELALCYVSVDVMETEDRYFTLSYNILTLCRSALDALEAADAELETLRKQLRIADKALGKIFSEEEEIMALAKKRIAELEAENRRLTLGQGSPSPNDFFGNAKEMHRIY